MRRVAALRRYAQGLDRKTSLALDGVDATFRGAIPRSADWITQVQRVTDGAALQPFTLSTADDAEQLQLPDPADVPGSVFGVRNDGTTDITVRQLPDGDSVDTVEADTFEIYVSDGEVYWKLIDASTPTGVAQYHDTTHSPVGLWQFNGNGDDSSGNGLDLNFVAGNDLYSYMLPGINGAVFGTSSTERWARPSHDADLEITGDITIEMFLLSTFEATNRWMVSFGAVGETEADNTLYMLGLDNTGRYRWIHEHGAGSNVDEPSSAPPWGMAHHVAAVRDGSSLLVYVNGQHVRTNSLSNAATGGTSADVLFRVGVNNSGAGEFYRGIISSLKVIDGALSAGDIKAEYNRTLGVVLGVLT